MKKIPAKAPASLVERIEREIVAPTVGDSGVRVQAPGFFGSYADAFDKALQGHSFRPEYVTTIRARIEDAKATCKGLGINYDDLVQGITTRLVDQLAAASAMSDEELHESRRRTVPSDLVIYSWQSPEAAEALTQDPDLHFSEVRKQGVYAAESSTKTSGYAGGAGFGVLVEIHVKQGTEYLDLTPRSVQNELHKRHQYHNSADVSDGYRKPLNRYSAVEGWWQVTEASQASFHVFDASARETKELLKLLNDVEAPALPFMATTINEALLARGEPQSGGLAAPVRGALTQKMERELRKFSETSYGGSRFVHASAALLELAASFPDLGDLVRDIESALTPSQRETLLEECRYLEEHSEGRSKIPARVRAWLGSP